MASIVAGVHMSDSPLQETQANGLKFINCQFNGSTASTMSTGPNPAFLALCVGIIAITVRNLVFENCQACNIVADNPFYHCFGFDISDSPEIDYLNSNNVRNITFSNCVASDIRTGGKDAVGFFFGSINLDRVGEQGAYSNAVIKNCIAECISSASATHLVAGIAQGLYPAEGAVQFIYPAQFNLFVEGCRVSDVRSTASPLPSSDFLQVL